MSFDHFSKQRGLIFTNDVISNFQIGIEVTFHLFLNQSTGCMTALLSIPFGREYFRCSFEEFSFISVGVLPSFIVLHLKDFCGIYPLASSLGSHVGRAGLIRKREKLGH